MIKKVIKLAVFLLVANAVYQIALHYFQFKDAVEELALFSDKATDAQLVNSVMGLAEEHSIPLEREYVEVNRQKTSLTISAAYLETMRFFPGTEYTWEFDIVARR
jgi:hypothetical protein